MRLTKWFCWIFSFPVVAGFHVPFSPQTMGQDPPLCISCANVMIQKETHTLVCAWFGSINVVNGQKTFCACNTARQHLDMCGPEGKYYVATPPETETPSETDADAQQE